MYCIQNLRGKSPCPDFSLNKQFCSIALFFYFMVLPFVSWGQACNSTAYSIQEFEVEWRCKHLPGTLQVEVALFPGTQPLQNVRGVDLQFSLGKDLAGHPVDIKCSDFWLNPEAAPIGSIQAIGDKIRLEINRGSCQGVSGEGIIATILIGNWTSDDLPYAQNANCGGGIVIIEEISLKQLPVNSGQNGPSIEFYDLHGNRVLPEEIEGIGRRLFIRRKTYPNGQCEWDKVWVE